MAITIYAETIPTPSKGINIFVNHYEELQNSHKGTFHSSNSLQMAFLTDILQDFVENKIKLTSIFVEGVWCEIDTKQDLQRAKKLFK